MIISIAVIIILISSYRPFETWYSEEVVSKINDLLFTLSCSYVAAWIFFVVTDYIPAFRKRKVDREYVKSQLNEIKDILEWQVEICNYLSNLNNRKKKKPTLKQFVYWYIEDDLFTPVVGDKSRFLISLEKCKIIRKITRELLFEFNKCLNIENFEKLEYLWKFYKVDENLDNKLLYVEGKTIHDERYLKYQAIVIYKAYEVMSHKHFKIPKHKIEIELRDEFFDNRCHCILNGTLCNGDFVTR